MKKLVATLALAATLVTQLITPVPAIALQATEVEAAGGRVVVLDPGHDATHIGAHYGEYLEEDLNLKIALYCRQALQANGYTVYMTRETQACSFGGSSISTADCLKKRFEFAKQVHASCFVSIHLNAATSPDPNGCEVYYSALAKASSKNAKLAKKIVTSLAAIGLNNRGVKKANYAVLNGTYNEKIPGALIEHCFMSSPKDVENYLSTDSGLKALGVADAKGIINYLESTDDDVEENVEINVTLNSATSIGKFNSVKLKWTATSGNADGYYIYRKTANTGWKQVGETTKSAFIDTTGYCNKTYTYAVAGYNSYGTGELSNNLSAKTGKAEISSLESKTIKFNGVTLKWSGVTGADGYVVYRRAFVDNDWTEWKAVLTVKNKAKTNDRTTQCGRKYQYYVRAFRYGVSGEDDDIVQGAKSPITEVTTKDGRTSITSIEKRSNAGAKIFWKEVPGATGYRVFRRTANGGKWVVIEEDTSKTAFVDKSAQPNTEYEYAVRPYKEVEEDIIWASDKSDPYKFTTGEGKKKAEVTSYEDEEDEDADAEDEEEEDEDEEEEDTSSDGAAPDLML